MILIKKPRIQYQDTKCKLMSVPFIVVSDSVPTHKCRFPLNPVSSHSSMSIPTHPCQFPFIDVSSHSSVSVPIHQCQFPLIKVDSHSLINDSSHSSMSVSSLNLKNKIHVKTLYTTQGNMHPQYHC